MALLRAHVAAIRQDPLLRDAHLIFAPERNTGHEGDFMWHAIARFPPITPCWEKGQQNGAGVWTTPQSKMRYGMALKYQFVARSISVYKRFICVNPYVDPGKREKELMLKFIDQLKRFRIFYPISENPGSQKKATLSGKVNKEGKVSHNAHDDLAMTLAMACSMLDMLEMRQVDWFDYVRVWPETAGGR